MCYMYTYMYNCNVQKYMTSEAMPYVVTIYSNHKYMYMYVHVIGSNIYVFI